MRKAVEELVGAARAGDLAESPWKALTAIADAAGEQAAAAITSRAAEAEEEAAERSAQASRRRAREAEEGAKRGARAARTGALDLGLGLLAAWLRDLAAAADGAGELALNADRRAELEASAQGIDGRRARRGAELVMDTRRRLTVNVNETLALEALTSLSLEVPAAGSGKPQTGDVMEAGEVGVHSCVGHTASVHGRSAALFGVRLYLAFAFASVAVITAGLAYLIVGDTGEQAADTQLTELAVGRTVGLADAIGGRPPKQTAATLAGSTEEGYGAWVFDGDGELVTPNVAEGIELSEVPNDRRAVEAALAGSRYVDELSGGVTVVGIPIFRDGAIVGAIIARSVPAPEVTAAIEEGRGDRLAGVAIAVSVALLVSFLIASAITSRVKRLAESAARISEGGLDEPLEGTGGRDEITDLGRALERMRGALRETFGALREERDRLSAIFEALNEAVMVVRPDGEVRFSNAAAHDLIGDDGKAIEPLVPWLRRAAAPHGGRERRAASRRERLRAQRPLPAGGGRGARGGPRPHRGASP